MKIYTSYHAKKKAVEQLGIIPVSISLYNPRYTTKYEHNYKIFAPTQETLSLEKEEYIPKFNSYLETLDFEQVKKQLENIAQGNDIALMCYEKVGDFCHRHLVANWLNEKGLEVKELDLKPKNETKNLFS